MNLVLFALSVLLPSLAGYTLIFGEKELSAGEKAIFSFTLGSGLLSFYLFLISLVGLSFSLFAVAAFFVPFFLFAVFRRDSIRQALAAARPRFGPEGLSGGSRVLYVALLSLIAWKLFYVIFSITSAPTVFWDAYSVWNFKAKVIYYGGGINTDPSSAQFMGGPFPHYPLNLPIMKSWVAFFLGKWDGPVINLYSALLFICLLGLVFIVLDKETGRARAVVFTYILTGIPVLVNNAIAGYADMPVAYYFLASVVMLFYWHKRGNNRLLFFSGILAALAMFTKNEGVAIVLPAVFMTFFFSLFAVPRSWKFRMASLLSFAVSFLAILLWFGRSDALKAIIRISEVHDTFMVFHPEGLKPLFEQLFLYRSYNIFWAGLIALLVIRWKRALMGKAKFFLVPAGVSTCIIFYVFLFTSNVRWLLNGTTINRTMLLVIPLFTVAGGFLTVGDGRQASHGEESPEALAEFSARETFGGGEQ